MTLIVLG